MHLRCIIAVIIVISLEKAAPNKFLIEEWVEQGHTVNMACKSESVFMYQPNVYVRWLKDGWNLNQTQRIVIDGNNNVEIIELQHDDRGEYDCEISHENERVIVNTVYLHFGSTGHTMGESGSWLNKQNETLGLDNVLVLSLMMSIAVLSLWGSALGWMRYKSRSASGDDDTEAALVENDSDDEDE